MVDPYEDKPNWESFRYYSTEGFNMIQNWCANHVLRERTGVEDAAIVNIVKPMRSNDIFLDEFEYVLEEILPLFMVLMYLLPIYRLTSRMVSEKQTKNRDVAKVMGLSETSYWLSWFVFYLIGVSVISVICAAILTTGVL